MIRVLHLCAGNLHGGVETAIAALSRTPCDGMETGLAACWEGRLSRAVPGTALLGPVRASRPWTLRRARMGLRSLLAREPADAVVAHGAWALAALGPAVRAAGVPLALWLHDAADGRHWVQRWARRCPPDLAVCNSAWTAGTLPSLFPEVRTEVVRYPLLPPSEESDREGVRRALATPDNAVVVVQAARMEPWKGADLLLEALGALRNLPGWTCWLVGGAQRAKERTWMGKLRRRAGRLWISGRVRLLGERADVPRVLAAADLFCHTPRKPEPFGIALVEALYAGLPVVTFPAGGAAEVVDASCGLLPEPGGLAEALRHVISDPALRRRLGAAGPARARALCDPERQAAQLRDVLARMLRGR